MAQLKDLIVSGASRFIGPVYDNSAMVAYGTCETAAATAAKVVTIEDSSWTLKIGNLIAVRFTNTNSASSVTLNVNGTGAKSLAVNTTRPYTSNSTLYTGYAGRVLWYMYDGTYWHWVNAGCNTDNNTYTSAYCSTAAGTAGKVATCSGYVLLANSYIHVIIATTNTAASALTLNINSKGAKPIYINGNASSADNYDLKAGSYLVYYDGTNYYFRTDGKITGDITGNAANITGTVAVANGGTGQTTANAAANAFINALGTGDATPIDTDYYISQFVTGNSATTTNANKNNYYRRPMSALWAYVKGKMSSDSNVHISGHSATVTSTYGLFGYATYSGANYGYATLKNNGARFGFYPTDDTQKYWIGISLAGETFGIYDEHSSTYILSTPTNTLSVTLNGNAKNVTGTVAVAHGGTGATTASAARTNLGAAPAYVYSTTDLTAGTSTLTTGILYFVYE